MNEKTPFHRCFTGVAARVAGRTAAFLLVAAAWAAAGPAATAEATGEGALGQIVRFEGYWIDVPDEAVESDPSSARAELGEQLSGDDSSVDFPMGRLRIVTTADGRGEREFAVTDVRTYGDVIGGMQVFRRTTIRPTLVVRGRTDTVSEFTNAKDGEPIVVTGSLGNGANELLLAKVEFPERESEKD